MLNRILASPSARITYQACCSGPRMEDITTVDTLTVSVPANLVSLVQEEAALKKLEIIPLKWRIKWKRKWKMKWKPKVPLKVYIGILPPIMENQMEKKMENEMETGVIWGVKEGFCSHFAGLQVPGLGHQVFSRLGLGQV